MLGRVRSGAQARSYVGASHRTCVGPCAVRAQAPARLTVCAASTAATAAPQSDAAAAGSTQQKQQSGKPKQARNPDAVTVYDKPASKYLLQRLQAAPEALLQAGGSKEDSTYRCIQTIAAANTMLVTNKDASQLLYVPGRPTPVFKATIVKTASSVADRPATEQLPVGRASNPAGIAGQLLKALLQGRSVAVKAAGAAAVAAATRAIQLAREGALEAGYEVGVWPSYVKEASGGDKDEITLLQQLVVRQELPAAEVVLPRSAAKSLDVSIALARRLLAKQQRLQLVVPLSTLEQLPAVLGQLHEAKGKGQRRRLLLMLPLDGTQTTPGTVTKSPTGNFTAQLRSSRWTNLAASQQLLGKPFYVARGSTTPEGLAAALSAQLESQEVLVVRTDGSLKAANVLLQALWAAEGRLMADQGLGLCALVDVRHDTPRAAAATAAAAASSSKATDKDAASPTTVGTGGVGSGKEAAAPPAVTADSKHTPKKEAAAAAATAASASSVTSTTAGNGSTQEGQQGAGSAGAAASAPASAAAAPATSPSAAGAGAADSSWGVVQALVTRRSEVALHVLQTPNKPLQVTCAPELADAALRSAAALTALLAMDEAGRGGLLLCPVLLASGELQLKFERLGSKLLPGLGDPGVEEFRVSHSTQPDALRGGIITRVAQNKATELTLASGGAASWRALMGVAVARLELIQMRQQRTAAQEQGLEEGKELLPELLGVVVTLGQQQLDSGDNKQMYGMRLVWQD